MQAGWLNYWRGDEIGIIDMIDRILKKTMLISLKFQRKVLNYPPLTETDMNISGLNFSQSAIDMFAIYRTPSALFCAENPEQWVAPPIVCDLARERRYDSRDNMYIYGEETGSEFSSLGGRHLAETTPVRVIEWRSLGDIIAGRMVCSVFPIFYFRLMEQPLGALVFTGTNQQANLNISLSRDFIRKRRDRLYVLAMSEIPTLITPDVLRATPDEDVYVRDKVPILGANRLRAVTRALDSLNF
jgi:hypothetical protein